jgi:hypothetical protein
MFPPEEGGELGTRGRAQGGQGPSRRNALRFWFRVAGLSRRTGRVEGSQPPPVRPPSDGHQDGRPCRTVMPVAGGKGGEERPVRSGRGPDQEEGLCARGPPRGGPACAPRASPPFPEENWGGGTSAVPEATVARFNPGEEERRNATR